MAMASAPHLHLRLRVQEIYTQYAEILSCDEAPGRTKTRLAALWARVESLGITGYTALNGLQLLNSQLQWELLDTRCFTMFYRFAFFLCREKGQKNISVKMAIDAWRLTLTGRFRLLDQWCSFVQCHQRFAIAEDTWRQVLEFSRIVHEDLSNYDPEGAWPVLVDDFVEALNRRRAVSCGDSNVQDRRCTASSGAAVVAMDNFCAHECSTVSGGAVFGTKRRYSEPLDKAAEAESVDCIAQRLADMQSPVLPWKRMRVGGTTMDTSAPDTLRLYPLSPQDVEGVLHSATFLSRNSNTFRGNQSMVTTSNAFPFY